MLAYTVITLCTLFSPTKFSGYSNENLKIHTGPFPSLSPPSFPSLQWQVIQGAPTAGSLSVGFQQFRTLTNLIVTYLFAGHSKR